MFAEFVAQAARKMTFQCGVGVNVVGKMAFVLFYKKNNPGVFVRLSVSEDNIDVYDKRSVDADLLEVVVRFLDSVRLYHRFPDRSREERLPLGTVARVNWMPCESPEVKYFGPLSKTLIATSDWCGLVSAHDTIGADVLIEIAEYAKKIRDECREVDMR